MRVSEQQIYAEMLEAIAQNYTPHSVRRLTGFCGLKGNRYNGGLMVVGRALNGLGDGFAFKELSREKRREEIAKDILSARKDKRLGSMSWVSEDWNPNREYNTARSAFWRVAKSVC